MRRQMHLLAAAALTVLASPSIAAAQERTFIDRFEAIPSSVMEIVGTVFPEKSAVGSSYLSGAYDPNLAITEQATVSVTFVHEGAGNRNSLGYFTYETDGSGVTIVDRQLIFPNASHADPNLGWGGGRLVPGDTVTLRDAEGKIRIFEPGQRVGFFIVSNGWTGSSVKGWDPKAPALPYATSAQNATGNVFSTLDALNPESSTGFLEKTRHIAMLRSAGQPGLFGGDDFMLVGFEDLRRDGGSDEDFNDVVVAIHASPIEAILQTEVPAFEPDNPDPDGDGVEGLADYFPNDPERAFLVRTPPTGWQTIAFEDRYPNVGDADYNDAVVQMAHEEVLSADGRLKDLSGTYHLFARGASLDHAFGLAVYGVGEGVKGTLEVERFAPDAERSTTEASELAAYLGKDTEGLVGLVLSELIPDTRRALSPESGGFTNTTLPTLQGNPASVRFVATFDAAIDRSSLGAAPFDPFLSVLQDGERWDIHLPGRRGVSTRPGHLPVEDGAESFLDTSGYPFALLLASSWRFPLERVHIEEAYPDFTRWRESRGRSSRDWFARPDLSGGKPRVTDPMLETVRTRPWTRRASEEQAPISCAANVCATGPALSATECEGGVPDPCIPSVCAADDYCCSSAWDAACVAAATDLCGACR